MWNFFESHTMDWLLEGKRSPLNHIFHLHNKFRSLFCIRALIPYEMQINPNKNVEAVR